MPINLRGDEPIIRRGRQHFTSVTDLKVAIRRYIQAHNSNYAKPFVWTKSAETILAAVKRASEVAGL